MPTSENEQIRQESFVSLLKLFNEFLKVSIKEEEGFNSTLKSLEKGRLPGSRMISVHEGVLEEKASGLVDAALQTDQGRVVLCDARRTDRPPGDIQSIPSAYCDDDGTTDTEVVTPAVLVDRFVLGVPNAPTNLIAEIELTRFDASQRATLLPLLWEFILHNRNSNSPDRLVGVGSAIRKYVAMMPMSQIGQLAELLASGQKASLPIELEIEVAKMIYRNFEVCPPATQNGYPELSRQLFEMAKAYGNPRVLLRDRYSAIASLSIQALVAMRSDLARDALLIAASSPYRWFGELVSDSLARLYDQWIVRHSNAAVWLAALREDVASPAT